MCEKDVAKSEPLYIHAVICRVFWMPARKYILKLCLLGDGAVGKTSLVRRFVFDVFDDKYIMSFGTKVSKKTVVIGESNVDLMIWDILGQRAHRSLHAAYYLGATGALCVCDLTRPETMESLTTWVEGFQSTAGPMPVVILGNKSDLPRAVSHSELKSFGARSGSDSLETSAKTGENVEAAFDLITHKMTEAIP
jgi:small GTP-binding protein